MTKIAVMGFGTVGSGVVEVLMENNDSIVGKACDELEVKYILDVREFPGHPLADRIIHDFSIIEQDPEIKIVAETIGGATIAYEFTKRCLLAGKSVVTSNKELVATHGLELLTIAKEKNINYLFEASVGGGIPIIRPLTRCLSANRIDEIYGILNGTTNYILTQMIQCGVSFEDALKQAQENGYAELNPAADIEGHDACRKISILADLSFGHNVNPAAVKTQGITNVTLQDVDFAGRFGYSIKLLGRALRTGETSVTAYVAPHLIAKTDMLSNVNDVMNAVVVCGNAVGQTMFYGAGAGKRPTASAVVADIVDAALHTIKRKEIGWEAAGDGFFTDSDALVSRWYVRITGEKSAILDKFGPIELLDADAGEAYALLTGEMDASTLADLTKTLDVHAAFRVLA